MAILIGVIADSSGLGVTGRLTVQLNAPLIEFDTSPNTVRYTKPVTYQVIDGDLSDVTTLDGEILPYIELIPTNETTYQFRFQYPKIIKRYYLVDTGTEYNGLIHIYNGSYYTEAVHSAQSRLLEVVENEEWIDLFNPFNASIPEISNVEFSDLQHSSVNTSNIDTSLYYIAQLMTQGSLLSNLISGIYKPRGNYNESTTYFKNDVVYYDKGSYWFISDNPKIGILPSSDQAVWMKIVETTEIVGETIDPTTLLLNTDSSTWDNVTNKTPNAHRIKSELANYAKLSSAVFGSLQAPTLTVGTSTNDVATMKALANAMNSYVPPPSTTAPNLGSIAQIPETSEIVNAYTLALVTRQYVRIEEQKPAHQTGGTGSASKIRNLEFIKANANYNYSDLAQGNIAEPKPPFLELQPGTYLIHGRAASCGTDGTRLNLITSAYDLLLYGESVHTGLTSYQLSYIGNTWSNVKGKITLTTKTKIGLYHLFQTYGSTFDLGKPCGRGGNEIYASLEVWKIG